MTPIRQRMLDALVLRGKALRTQEACVEALARLARHYRRSPDTLTSDEVQRYLPHLLRERKLGGLRQDAAGRPGGGAGLPGGLHAPHGHRP